MDLHLVIMRFVEDMLVRVHGPMTFRLILQPLSAAIPALRAGMHDANSGGPKVFFDALRHPEKRKGILAHCWKDVFKVFVFAVLIDLFFSITVIHWIYPAETLTVAALLAVVPYAIVRVTINVVASAFIRMPSKKATSSVPNEPTPPEQTETQS